jgi:hypothetical protein
MENFTDDSWWSKLSEKLPLLAENGADSIVSDIRALDAGRHRAFSVFVRDYYFAMLTFLCVSLEEC